MLAAWWIAILCTSLISTTLAGNKKSGKKPAGTRADVGRFSIPINDDQIGDWKANRTLQNHLADLVEAAFELWFQENATAPTTIEAQNLTQLAKSILNNTEYETYGQPLMDLANQSLQADSSFLLENGCSGYLNDTAPSLNGPIFQRCFPDEELVESGTNPNLIGNKTAVNIFMNDTFFDLVSEYTQAVYNTSVLTRFYNFGALMGLGWTVECSEQINTVLESKNPWTNAGSQAATTLMALLPTFLAFGNLYVPRSSEVFATSSLVGLGSSLYSFGLPVQSLSVIPDKQNFNLATFGLATLAMIASFASVKEKVRDREDKRPGKAKGPLLDDLHDWSQEIEVATTSMDEAKNRFAQIKRSAIEDCDKRWHWWYLPSVLVTASQAIMFGLAIYPLLADVGTPRFLFTCYQNWTGAYLAITASINAVFRFCMWEVGYHERVLIYSLSPPAKNGNPQRSTAEEKLRELIYGEHSVERQANSSRPLPPSMQTELPPLYPPLMSWIWASLEISWEKSRSSFYKLFQITPRDFEKDIEDIHDRYKVHLEEYRDMLWRKKALAIILNAMKQAFHKNIYMIKNMWSSNPSRTSRRYRPLVVLIHLSTAGRNFFKTLLTGFVEASLYLVLTFFLASQWGGNLVITGFALSLLLIFTTAGRALGLVYVWISTRFHGLNVVNCDSHEEILGSLRIICSMKEVLVVVNGGIYYDGYRLNGLDGFREWQKKYDAGDFDYWEDDSGRDFKKSGKDVKGMDSDVEMASLESQRSMSTKQVDRETSTRIEIQRRHPFERMTTEESGSSDYLVQDHVKRGFGVPTLNVRERGNSMETVSRMYDSE